MELFKDVPTVPAYFPRNHFLYYIDYPKYLKLHNYGLKLHNYVLKLHKYVLKLHNYGLKLHNYGLKLHTECKGYKLFPNILIIILLLAI